MFFDFWVIGMLKFRNQKKGSKFKKPKDRVIYVYTKALIPLTWQAKSIVILQNTRETPLHRHQLE